MHLLILTVVAIFNFLALAQAGASEGIPQCAVGIRAYRKLVMAVETDRTPA
jgi:hypothetical protein